jgi:hypothetical protein
MKVYKEGENQFIVTFDKDEYAHISIFISNEKEYIEYHKKRYPGVLLTKDKEIKFEELDSKLKDKLRKYFDTSLTNARKKVNIFTEAINLCL